MGISSIFGEVMRLLWRDGCLARTQAADDFVLPCHGIRCNCKQYTAFQTLGRCRFAISID